MPALTQDRPTPEREGCLVSNLLAANAVVFAGAMYVLDAEGKATAATAASTKPVRAVALARADQAAGDERVDGAVGVFCFDNDAAAPLTIADIGAAAYVSDDQTVKKTEGSCKAGVVFDVDERGVWVRIGA